MATKHVNIKNNIPKVINGLSSTQLKKLGLAIGARFEDKLKKRIEDSDPRWAPLAEVTVKQKKGQTKQWYDTGTTGGEIKYKYEYGKAYAGWIEGGEVAKIAEYLEYGTKTKDKKIRIPARPLIVPVFEENKDKVIKDAKAWIQKAVKKGRI